MRKIILDKHPDEIIIHFVNHNSAIFAWRKGILQGMVVNEHLPKDTAQSDRWIIRIGGSTGLAGHHPSLEACIKSGMDHGYEFYTA